MTDMEEFLIIGHRGSRGLKPENTIPAFLKAVKLGARGLEMDLYVTKDGQVVVTHDATISAELCLSPEGSPLKEEKSKRLKIYELNLKDIKPFDCGSEPNPDFPEQENTEAHIPLLGEVVEAIRRTGSTGNAVHYFIEFKSAPENDGIYHPEPKVFARKVVEAVREKDIQQQSTLMSFDKRCLQEVRKLAPEIRIGIPVTDKNELKNEIDQLGFTPNAIFPHFAEIDENLMAFADEHKLGVFPWTVNQVPEMEQVLQYNVSGLITDYPDKALKLVNGRRI